MAENRFIYLGKLISNLINLIGIEFEDLKEFWGFEDEVNQLRNTLVAIDDLVEDAEQKQRTVVDVRWWLRFLKQDAYQTQDLLSELAYQTTRIQVSLVSIENLF
ncbi:hypothetical protein M5689_002281 [Euphorbia peplus]|nr:hypothetical protein M5689_002281 [Euphorbia peplus]